MKAAAHSGGPPCLFWALYASPVGKLHLAGDGESLLGLWLEGQKYFGGGLPPGESRDGGACAPLRLAAAWLDRYFAGERPRIEALPLRPLGSPFRQAVWRRLCQIPYGQTVSYGALARELAAALGYKRLAAQAVGGAVGHNPISIIIPCHRVLGADGRLTGYAGGLAAKRWLLAHEGCILPPEK